MSRTGLIVLVTLAVVGLHAGPIYAQGTDFSGTWTLDPDASVIPQGSGGGRGGFGGARGGAGGRGGPAGAGGAAPTITVTQTASELVIDQHVGGQSRTLTYQLDGSESSNPGLRGGTATTTTTWDGADLVTEGSQTVSTPRGEFTLAIRERRTLSDDDQTLTVAATRTTPRGDIESSLVYRRSQ